MLLVDETGASKTHYITFEDIPTDPEEPVRAYLATDEPDNWHIFIGNLQSMRYIINGKPMHVVTGTRQQNFFDNTVILTDVKLVKTIVNDPSHVETLDDDEPSITYKIRVNTSSRNIVSLPQNKTLHNIDDVIDLIKQASLAANCHCDNTLFIDITFQDR